MARIDSLLQLARAQGSSDLHLAGGAPPRIRVRGELEPLANAPALTTAELESAMSELLSAQERQEFSDFRDVEITYGLAGVARFRVSYYTTLQGPAAVFRLVPEQALAIETLALPPAFEPLLSRRTGLVLLAAPHGSGRSTLCASIVDRIIGTSARVVVSIEDPIEVLHGRKQGVVLQREVGRDVPQWGEAFRAAERLDAEVIVAGDLPDAAALRAALHAAEGGRLVIAAVPVPGAVRAIERLVDLLPAGEQLEIRAALADNLLGVLSQVLLRRKDGNGRVAAHELLLTGPDVISSLREGELRELAAVLDAGKGAGMQSLDDSIDRLLKAGVVVQEEAARKAVERARFA
ncbi:MAG TPA: ATPase, T2SS/T4P/T4SS family [bacterium]|nr:ATPase, T2SS/T4P/T4SS family [bacterium]